MEATETKTIGKYKIEVIQDESPYSPREDDNLGTMVCFHRRYNLGDSKKHHGFSDSDELNDFIRENKKNICVILPLYIYDHSGLTMNTTGFSCPWDSSRVGVIYIMKKKVREEYGWKRITKARIEKIRQYLVGEVETYDQYLTGDVYGYRITDTTNDEVVDSCWGFYGEEYCMTEATGEVECMIKNDEKELKELGMKGQLELEMK